MTQIIQNISCSDKLVKFNLIYDIRQFMTIKIKEVLNLYRRFYHLHSDIKNTISKLMEIGCYNSSINYCNKLNIESNWHNINFINIYKTNIGKILYVFNSNENPNITKIIDNIIDNHYNPDDIIKLMNCAAYEIDDTNTKKIQDNLNERENIKLIYKISDILVCNKCNLKRICINPVQLSSPDEVGSFRCECMNCGNIFYN